MAIDLNGLDRVDEITRGCAECLWAMAWADAREEAGNSVQGEITSQMPDVPALAYVLAAGVVGFAQQLNGCSMYVAYNAAQNAADFDEKATRERFGYCLAYSYVGAGVTWGDDHPAFLVPHRVGGQQVFMWPRGESPWELHELALEYVSHGY